ncbi:hypothetical protein SAMN04488570_0500 [Nocardioides scoriae]|uniref:Uncharacterized protein n=1 Tax=Nocardioides scoriae TaxID=642780 RepID=A0A1H1M935_9ACTN|nr:hypothetical protein SAMN04488570_0500 [Nocardioides scoriae]
MSERTCPVCGGPLALVDSHDDPRPGPGEEMVHACTTPGCEGRLEGGADQDRAAANEPTGGDGIGA